MVLYKLSAQYYPLMSKLLCEIKFLCIVIDLSYCMLQSVITLVIRILLIVIVNNQQM